VTNNDGTVTLSYTTTNATSCFFNPEPSAGIYQSMPCSTLSGSTSVVLPKNMRQTTAFYRFALTASGAGQVTKAVKIGVAPGAGRPPLSGVKTVLGTPGGASCALLIAGGVDCWGDNATGSLGNGTTSAPQMCPDPCATTPHPVVGVGGAGVLSGVVQLALDVSGTFCARLGSGGVDCWGPEVFGELGDGSGTGPDACAQACTSSPVVVMDALGPLSGATDLQADTQEAFCAALSDGQVDCWGFGGDSDTGQGTTGYTNPIAAPVVATGSQGEISPPPLTGVARLSAGGIGFCAILTTSGAVCWGLNRFGNLGMGTTNGPNPCHGQSGGGDCSAEPQTVVTSNGKALVGVNQIVPDGILGWCAVLASSGVDCWGDNNYGELGDGSTSGPTTCLYGPCAPYAVPVVGLNGTGILRGVRHVASNLDLYSAGGSPTMCAVLPLGHVACWGSNAQGQLGQGTAGNPSPVPVVVAAPGSTNPLAGVSAIAGADGIGYCVAASGGLDCWGDYFSIGPSAAISNVGGTGTLKGVTGVVGMNSQSGYCAIVTGGMVDCLLHYNPSGQLGNGSINQVTPPAPTPASLYNSPVRVLATYPS
jgi:alpha-tubulin suppressor-like RCC1 family protein